MSTIKDVAAAAGVSVSTVSNIINNKSSVNIDLYNRVMQVMKELHYRPNILERICEKIRRILSALFLGNQEDTRQEYWKKS